MVRESFSVFWNGHRWTHHNTAVVGVMELVLLEELQEGHLRDVGCNGRSIHRTSTIA